MNPNLDKVLRQYRCALIAFCLGVSGCSAQPVASAPPAPSPKAEPVLHLAQEPNTLVLAFDDEFDTFDPWWDPKSPWRTTFDFGPPNSLSARTLPSNGEQEIYADPTLAGEDNVPMGINPFSVKNGILNITADRTPAALKKKLWNMPYTSGMLSTRDDYSQTYGYFEMRAQLPAGRGMWPGFWLMPSNGSWPPEIDIFEMLGHEPSTIYTTVHSNATGKHTFTIQKIAVAPTNEGFHTYGVDVGPKVIRWYVDRLPVFEAPTPPDLVGQPMYILVTLVVGGFWSKNPDETTVFPNTMKIDYIRTWKYQAPPAAH